MRKRKLFAFLAGLCLLGTAGLVPAFGPGPATAAAAPCDARARQVATLPFQWYAAPEEDMATLEQWCRGVGAPVVATPPIDPGAAAPPLEDLVVVSWNAHLADGQLTDLISDLRAGALTSGVPVQHFVLLLQELYRRGEDVPQFAAIARSAFAIEADDPAAPGVEAYVRQLGLSMAYVPSMRNGAELLEDRGNAIVSSEPLIDLFAMELPFERQRRVVAGAAVRVRTSRGIEKLHLLDAHLEPLASPSSLWVFRNPRRRQMAAILDLLREPRFAQQSAGTVLGGDFNTVQGGAREAIYRDARAWSRSLAVEDPRSTHLLGRLDYVFARLAPGWEATTIRIDERYGSDHHPVLAQFRKAR